MLINNLARYYYNAKPLEATGSRDGGNGDLTGFRLWEAAPNLISHLIEHRSLVQDRTVIDLGAGTGAVGLAAAALGARRVVLSDADSTATLEGEHGWEERSRLVSLAENIAINGKHAASASVAALRWGDDEHLAALTASWPVGFETLVGSDVLYSPRMYEALATSILALAAPNALLVLSYPLRHGDEHTFYARLAPAFERVGIDGRGAPVAEEEGSRTAGAADEEGALQIAVLRRTGS